MIALMRVVMIAVVLASGGSAGAQQPTQAPAETQPQQPAEASPPASPDTFGAEVMMVEKPIVYFSGNGNWDAAFETIVDAFKTVQAYMAKQGLKANGPAMTIYTATDDLSFSFLAAIPIADPPKDTPRGDLGVGMSPAGKALRFAHRGSYDSMDTTYEAITTYLDEKQLDAKEMFIEEYQTDPVSTPEDKLVVYVYVPVN